MIRKKCLKLDFSPGWYFSTAMGILILPVRWLAAVYLAVLIHELGHIIVMRLQNVTIYSVRFHGCGAVIFSQPMTAKREWICAAAGPAASLLLLPFLRIYPELAFCGLCQGLFNLMPVYPFDGGRMIRALIGSRKYSDRGSAIVLTMAVIGLTVFFPRWTPVIAAAGVAILSGVLRNISCKDGALAVQ